MNRRLSAIAVSAAALGAVALTSTEAAAIVQDPDRKGVSGARCVTAGAQDVTYVPVRTDDADSERAQAGGAAIGGAGLALGGLWLYRRRRTTP